MNGKSIEIQDGLTYTDGTNFYSGTLTYERYAEIGGSKLVRYDGYGARLEGYSLSIQEDGDIGVNFYMLLDDSIVNNANAKMRFVLPVHSNENLTKTIDMPIPEPTEVGGKTYYVFKCPVAAKEMTAAITAQMYIDGVATGNQYTYTVRDWINAVPAFNKWERRCYYILLLFDTYKQYRTTDTVAKHGWENTFEIIDNHMRTKCLDGESVFNFVREPLI